ncbi:purine-nucleoside phosphorylase [Sphingobacterium alkalisoli]|uniref:Purine nucleoside phosphorylase n=1 Tax=Sphingobacterium alkalisoli TaxID=1874115 RepID=A0A4V6WF81_9SPHI|nr:purine-nucleoside phosphorylase [Sphingobacterium alkalisoli]TJY68159.1 purine-nucleoside phosphorylase [Sphingobacterium alkalisoli]GGH08617.1 purine nucleoside phosphorylase [Sphingobacterium alkalisoli]
MYHLINETVSSIRRKIGDFKPEFGIILGTGLGKLVNEIEITHQLMYANIPNFPISTVEFHSGKLIFGKLNGRNVVAMQGRLHYYEGYDMQEITFPVRIMKALGIEKLFVSNASGSLNPTIQKGHIGIVDDHINLLPDNPLRGSNDADYGPRFPDMSAPYDKVMLRQGLDIADRLNIIAHKVVYVATPGPNLETKAEYRYMRIIGGDIVGMSTVPEVIVANHMGLPVFAISVITDEGYHADLKPVSLAEIVAVANEAEPKLTAILKELIALQ